MPGYIHAVATLFKKEMQVILRDPRNRVILIVPVLLQSLIFGYVASYDLNRVSYALLDQDNTFSSRELASRFDGTGIFERKYTLDGSTRTADILDEKKAILVLAIPPGFERELEAGKKVPVQVSVDGRNGNVAGIVSGYASAVIESYSNDRLRARKENSQSIRILPRSWYNPNLETRWNFISGMLVVLTMVQVLLLSALTVSREREQGTFDQLLVTPFSPLVILAGKSAPTLFIGLFQASLVLGIALFWFHIPFSGSYPLLFVGLVLFNLAAIGIGLCISTLTATMQQSMLYAFSLIVTLMLLSGFITPVSSMPEWLQDLTIANPVRHGVEIVQRIYLQGADLKELLAPFIAMIVIASITLGCASRLFRHNT